jgi:hypothetical protein
MRFGIFASKKLEQPLFLNFQIEFSRWKRARIEKKSSNKLFLFAIRIKKAQKTSTFFEQVTHFHVRTSAKPKKLFFR